jgi:hypothetical protein
MEFDFITIIFYFLITAVISVFVYFIIVTEEFSTTSVVSTKKYKVVALSYAASYTTTGVGPAIGGKGGIAVTTNYNPSQSIVVLRNQEETLKFNDEELFNSVEQNDEITLVWCKSWSRIRLTDFKFSHGTSLCLAKTKKSELNIFGSLVK